MTSAQRSDDVEADCALREAESIASDGDDPPRLHIHGTAVTAMAARAMNRREGDLLVGRGANAELTDARSLAKDPAAASGRLDALS